MAVAGSAGELRMSGSPSLREMAAIAPPPWDGIFAAHRNALLLLVREIDAITKSNRDLLERGQLAAREAIASLGEIDVDTGPRECCRVARRVCTWSPSRSTSAIPEPARREGCTPRREKPPAKVSPEPGMWLGCLKATA